MKAYKAYSLMIIFLLCGIIQVYAQGLQRVDKLAFPQEARVVNDDFPKVNISLDLRDMEII
jgi:hypothetical protein